MDETMSHVSLSVEKREDEIYIPPKQSVKCYTNVVTVVANKI